MILVRNVFHLKFGKAREAVAIMKDGIAIQKKLGSDLSARLLTDVTGQFYTLVLELTAPNLAALETSQPRIMGDKDWQANYQKLVPLIESGHREIFTIVE
jgi:NIPSNAP